MPAIRRCRAALVLLALVCEVALVSVPLLVLPSPEAAATGIVCRCDPSSHEGGAVCPMRHAARPPADDDACRMSCANAFAPDALLANGALPETPLAARVAIRTTPVVPVAPRSPSSQHAAVDPPPPRA